MDNYKVFLNGVHARTERRILGAYMDSFSTEWADGKVRPDWSSYDTLPVEWANELGIQLNDTVEFRTYINFRDTEATDCVKFDHVEYVEIVGE